MVSKFQQLAMSRQAQQTTTRRDFWIYIDEFANFITPSMAEILSGARKYRIGLTLAHHELHQLQRDPEVASAVMSHPFTRVVFRVGDDDAKKLAEGFSYFEAKDLRNLEAGRAVCRVERSDFDFNLGVPLPGEPDKDLATARRQEVITVSREKYGTARADVEAMLAKSRESVLAVEPPTSPPAKPVPELPETSQVPKAAEPPTIVEAVPPVVVAEIPKEQPPAIKHEPPRDLGRGGAPHQAIQERLQAEAQKLGFLAEVEKQLAKGSNQAADLVLRRGDVAIAVEITVTTTASHEFENIQKCLDAGFEHVAMIATNPKRLEEIAAAVQGGLGPEATAKVSYYSPDDFIAELRKLAAELNVKPEPLLPVGQQKRRGLTVRRHLPQLSTDEQKLREDAIHQMLAQAMRVKLKNV
jgi:hypothetical protein